VPMPDDAALLDLFASWCDSRRTAEQILVRNPETVYGFPRARQGAGSSHSSSERTQDET
jgi:hypothetical protein